MSMGSDTIKTYYNEEMGAFMTTIFDGYNNFLEQERIIKNSIELPNIDKILESKYNLSQKDIDKKELDKICYDVLIDFCNKHNINIIK